jgi:hypothetical protein
VGYQAKFDEEALDYFASRLGFYEIGGSYHLSL